MSRKVRDSVMFIHQQQGVTTMLVLSRKANEAVLLGDGISVKVIWIKHSQVRLLIKAPQSVAVDREEVRASKQQSPARENPRNEEANNTAKPKTGRGSLVFTLKKGDKFFIGDDIVVQAVEFRGKQVRLGFEAPTAVPITRSELLP